MKRIRPRLHHFKHGLQLLLLTGLIAPAQALQIQSLATDLGGLFHYDVTVLNDDPIPELLLVSISDAPLGDGLIESSLTAPSGFLASYNAGLGLLDFIADTTPIFPSGPTGLFSFDSSAPPDAALTTYEAIDLSGELFTGTVDSRLVRAVAAPGVPALFTLGLVLLAHRRVVERQHPSAAHPA